MSYSFFGTCANDHEQFFICLETIISQTIQPKELILVDSGTFDIKDKIQEKIANKNISLIYIFQKLPRVKALNVAINHSSSKISCRFDSRSRFDNNYAKNVLMIFNDRSIDAKVVGGSPNIICENKNFESILSSGLIKRSYIFFYPNHRKSNFNGYSSSVYLGCFDTKILKEIKYRDSVNLISEDSLIIYDFLKQGYKTFISSKVKISYVSRTSFFKTIKLFNNYGYCRASTILMTKNLFLSMRHLRVSLIFLIISLLLIKKSFSFLFLLPLFLFLFNLIGELFTNSDKRSILFPICGTLCQLAWIVGFIWKILTIFKSREKNTNFIS